MAEYSPSRKPTSKSAAVAIQGASKFAGLVVQFFFFRLCVQWLGMPGYGTFVFAATCATFLGLIDFGLPAATQRFIGEAMARSDLVRVAAIFRFACRAHALFAVLALVLFGAFSVLYASFWRVNPTDPHALLLFLCGLQAATVVVMTPALTMAYALDRFREVATITFIQGIVTPLLGLLMLYFFRSPEVLAASTVIGGIVNVIVAYWLCGARVLPKPGPFTAADRKRLFSLSSRGYPTSITTVIGNNADKVMIQRAGVGSSLASYYIAGRLPETIYQIVSPIAATVYPELTRLAGSDDEAFNRAVERNVRFTLALAGSLIIVPSAFSESILTFWMHRSFVEANPGVLLVFPFMALYRALELVYSVIGMTIFARGVPQYGIPFAIFNATVTVVATVPMFRWQGIAGVGLMNALIDLSQIIPMLFVLRKFVAPGIRISHLGAGFASVLGLSGVFFLALRMGVDRPLAHICPAAGFCLAPVAALLAIATMIRVRICEVPDGVAARIRRLPFGRFVLAGQR